MSQGFAKTRAGADQRPPPAAKRPKTTHTASRGSATSTTTSTSTSSTSRASTLRSAGSAGTTGTGTGAAIARSFSGPSFVSRNSGSGKSVHKARSFSASFTSASTGSTSASASGTGARRTTGTPEVLPLRPALRRPGSSASIRTTGTIDEGSEASGLGGVVDEDSGVHQSPAEELEEKDTGIDASFPTFTEQEYDAAFRPRSISVYVKAFNFALETVLKHESHLFDEGEKELFGRYKSLPYEAQYLYVRLFLRKTAAWFRLDKLKYYSDIGNLPRACSSLWDPEIGLAESSSAFSSLEEAAELLSLDELKTVAKEAKVTGTNKSQLLTGLKRASSGQASLQGNGQLKLEFDRKGECLNRDSYFMGKVKEVMGPCIRLSQAPADLFNRVHLIFYRSTEYTEKSLRTVVLARMSKKNFPDYFVSRSGNIFPTRAALLEFEKAIKLQSEVDDILQSNGVPTKEGLTTVLDIFERIWERWKVLVSEEAKKTRETSSEDGLMERVYLRRFNAAWVYTRIVHKGVYVLGRFKFYAREHEVLTALLSQKFFHGARRGGWYQRKALIEENYMSTLPAPINSPNVSVETLKKNWRRKALETCISGIRDPETHICFHYELQKRIMKLEKKLKVPHKEQHDFGHARLLAPTKRIIYGTKVSETALGRKTIWLDPDPKAGKGAKCSVEEMCLSEYRKEGWKGYHCEGRLMTTLFAYLFYDILFLYLPNVFETEYQTCPLDLHTTAFYPSRSSEINHRLVDLENGAAKGLIEAVDEAQRKKQTCVVGLDWSFSREDLCEIVECIGGRALAVICKVLAEEYSVRTGGLPDLFLWRKLAGTEGKEGKDGEGGTCGGECLFVEVKSENDRLSETQRLWLHVLSTAGVKTELCSALEISKKPVEETKT